MRRPQPRAVVAGALLALLVPTSVSACGADPGLQRQEARQLALTCRSLNERDRSQATPDVPFEPFLDAIRRRPDVNGGHTTRDIVAKDLCPRYATRSIAKAITSLFGSPSPFPGSSAKPTGPSPSSTVPPPSSTVPPP